MTVLNTCNADEDLIQNKIAIIWTIFPCLYEAHKGG